MLKIIEHEGALFLDTVDEVQKAEQYGGIARGDLKDSDFVFPDERKFPIMTRGDVEDAVSSWGRYKGEKSFDEFKRRLKAIAKRKGFTSALPDKWSEDEGANNG